MNPRPDNFQMTPQRQEFLDGIIAEFGADAAEKFQRGQAEHGGNLWERAAFPEAYREAVDLVIYFGSLRRRLKEIRLHMIKSQLLQATDREGAQTHAELAISMLDAELKHP